MANSPYMTIKALQETFKNELNSLYPLDEINSFFFLLSASYLGKKRIDIALSPLEQLSEEESAPFIAALEQLKNEYPIQYIIGEASFMDFNFEVNEHVLIPRPETEELVNWILEDYENSGNINILDIGTGSGCIPISIAKYLSQATVSAIDISEKAIEVAKRNAKKNNATVQFYKENILNTKQLPQSYELIVSNPPYVRESEKTNMKKNVLHYEPGIALFVTDDDPLLFYKHIALLALKSLKSSGRLYFEINQYLGAPLCELLATLGFEKITLKKDVFGVDRMIRAIKN